MRLVEKIVKETRARAMMSILTKLIDLLNGLAALTLLDKDVDTTLRILDMQHSLIKMLQDKWTLLQELEDMEEDEQPPS